MSFIRAILVFAWLFVSCVVGLVASLFKWAGVDVTFVAARVFSFGVFRICGIKFKAMGLENIPLDSPCIYVGNHQSATDMATYGGILPPRTVVISKTELKWVPLFGLMLWAGGNIFINRSRKDSAISGLEKAVAEIKKRGVSVWIFPEGTRNKSGRGLLPFKKGAFHMAIAAGIPIVPLVSSSLNGVAMLETPDIRGGEVTVKVLPQVPTTGLTKADVDRLSNLVREKMLSAMV